MAFHLASFNARDLFDDQPPGVVGDLDRKEWTPGTQARAKVLLDRKLTVIADVLARMDADIVCLQEVKGDAVLGRLLEKLPAHVAPYPHRVVCQGGDSRGINTAVLSRFPFASTVRHHNKAEDPAGFRLPSLDPSVESTGPALFFKRGLLEVAVDVGASRPLVLFNVHLKSNYAILHRPATNLGDLAEGLMLSTMTRMAEALMIRRWVDERLAADPDALLAVLGDFNDVPTSMPVRTVAGDSIEGVRRGWTDAWLRSVTSGLPEASRFSNIYRGKGELLDHILVSRALWARFDGVRLLNETLYEPEAVLGAATYEGPDSDHAAVVAKFK